MRILKYWKRIPLNTPFHADFDLVPVIEIKDSISTVFDAVVEAVKKSDFDYSISNHETNIIEKRGADLPRGGSNQ